MYRYNRRCSCDRCKSHALMAPAILVTLGILFLLEEFGSWRLGFDHTWPLILIVVGGIILAKRNASMAGHIDPAQEYVVMAPPQSQSIVPAPTTQTEPPAPEVNHG
jgi:hypothetical protein